MPKVRPLSIDKQIGKRMRKLREERGMTLRELAGKLGLAFNAVAKYERGETSITMARLTAIAVHLGVPVATFFKE